MSRVCGREEKDGVWDRIGGRNSNSDAGQEEIPALLLIDLCEFWVLTQ